MEDGDEAFDTANLPDEEEEGEVVTDPFHFVSKLSRFANLVYFI